MEDGSNTQILYIGSIKKNLNAESENLQLIQPKAKVNQVYSDKENLKG